TLFAFALLSLASCGGGPTESFSQTFPDADEAGIRDLVARLDSAPARDEPAVLAGVVTQGTKKLFLYDVAQARVRWSVDAAPVRPPFGAGDTVITHEGGLVMLRDVATGEVRGRVQDEGLALVGADGEGRRASFVLSTGGGMSARSRIVFVENGGVSWSAAS